MTDDASTDGGRAAEVVEVSILLPTRDRADQLRYSIDSILASTFRDFELLVVVQGQADDTESLVRRLAGEDSRIHLLRDPEFGSSHARNVGMRAARGRIVAFTDDDCHVAPDWLAQMVQAFRTDQRLGVACGTVTPGPHDATAGFIVGYWPKQRERLTGPLAKLRDAGIGANLAFQRRAIEDAGGWDELLGAGSGVFEGAGDFDLIYRVVGAGYALLQIPEAQVTHHGFRNWEVGTRVIRGRFRGIGGAYGKHVRLGDPVAVVLLLKHVGLAGLNLAVRVFGRKRPFGLGRLLALLSGFRASFAYKVDPKTRRYIPGAGRAAR